MQPVSTSVPAVSGGLARPPIVVQGAVRQAASSSVALAPGVAYQPASAPIVRVVSSQAQASPAASVVINPGSTRTVVGPTVYSTPATGAPTVLTSSTVLRSATTAQAQPVIRVQQTQAAPPQVVRTVRVSTASSAAASRAVVVPGGPTYTQVAYEAKHQQDDPQLKSLKELRRTSGLKTVPVAAGLAALKSSAEDGQLTKDKFMESYTGILEAHEIEVPPDSVRTAVWDLFDRDGNQVVDMMELICGISLLCAGTEEDKIHAVFEVFDENSDGFISMDEMFKFLTSVYKVVLTPNVLAVMNTMGVNVVSAEDLASVTALECFKSADLNHDGKLSISEFKNWFYTPRNDPTSLFSPTRKLLQ